MSFLNLLPITYYRSGMSGEELLTFAMGAVSVVLMLLVYYQKISRKFPRSTVADELTPIYSYKDLLLQEKMTKFESIQLTTKTSMSTRIITFILILFVITTPLYQLFKFEHFV